MSFMQTVKDFLKPHQATLQDVDRLVAETNAMAELINADPKRYKNDPITVQLFGCDYQLLNFTAGEVEICHCISGEIYTLPCTFAGVDTLHQCLFNYCNSRNLFK